MRCVCKHNVWHSSHWKKLCKKIPMPERISLVFAPEYCSSSQHILEQYLLENLQRILFALFRHLQEHNDHSIQWQEVSYLEHEEDWKKRQIKEALCINAMDSKETMNLEKGFEIYPCWNELNSHIQNIAQKKESRITKFSGVLNFRNFVFSKWQLVKLCQYQECLRDPWWRHHCRVETSRLNNYGNKTAYFNTHHYIWLWHDHYKSVLLLAHCVLLPAHTALRNRRFSLHILRQWSPEQFFWNELEAQTMPDKHLKEANLWHVKK